MAAIYGVEERAMLMERWALPGGLPMETALKEEVGGMTGKTGIDLRLLPLSGNRRFDVGKDGCFLMPVLTGRGGVSTITVILNWTEGLRK